MAEDSFRVQVRTDNAAFEEAAEKAAREGFDLVGSMEQCLTALQLRERGS